MTPAAVQDGPSIDPSKLDAHEGRWVGVKAGEVVASGESPTEVMRAAAGRAVDLIFRVDRADEPKTWIL